MTLTQKSLVTFPFPLEDGTQAYFYLPPRLTEREAERMIAYLNTLIAGYARDREASNTERKP